MLGAKYIKVGKQDLRSLLASWVGQASREMLSDPTTNAISLKPLRRLQRKLDTAISSTGSKEDLFLIFFLTNFIQDVFYNLTGEVLGSEELEQEKQTIYGEMANGFTRLANVLEQETKSEELHACADIVYAYLHGIASIDSILRRKQ